MIWRPGVKRDIERALRHLRRASGAITRAEDAISDDDRWRIWEADRSVTNAMNELLGLLGAPDDH